MKSVIWMVVWIIDQGLMYHLNTGLVLLGTLCYQTICSNFNYVLTVTLVWNTKKLVTWILIKHTYIRSPEASQGIPRGPRPPDPWLGNTALKWKSFMIFFPTLTGVAPKTMATSSVGESHPRPPCFSARISSFRTLTSRSKVATVDFVFCKIKKKFNFGHPLSLFYFTNVG